jgi:hypothetical protein
MQHCCGDDQRAETHEDGAQVIEAADAALSFVGGGAASATVSPSKGLMRVRGRPT